MDGSSGTNNEFIMENLFGGILIQIKQRIILINLE
jgi:hypothetical protein